MAPRKGSQNALKHGLYARHFPSDILPEFHRMPVDSLLNELAALRFTADRALDLYKDCPDWDARQRNILVTVKALETAANILVKNLLLEGKTPVLQELWDAIDEANRIEGVDDAA